MNRRALRSNLINRASGFAAANGSVPSITKARSRQALSLSERDGAILLCADGSGAQLFRDGEKVVDLNGEMAIIRLVTNS